MASEGDKKPNVLVLGGLGFIGRHVVVHLVKNELIDVIRVVDKVMPPMAWLSPEHKEIFSKVEFKHANLINPASAARAFQPPEGVAFDYVINCAAETKWAQSDAVYRDGIYKLSSNCIAEAEKYQVKRYVELSTALMLHSDTAIKEDCKCEPWNAHGKFKYAVECDLMQRQDTLDFIIVRPAIVYGQGDRLGITPRLVIGAVYKYLGEKMKVLWTKDLKTNTVHVVDVARAIWHLCIHGQRGEIYNLCDKGNSTQGNLCDIVSDIFSINVDYLGAIMSTMAKISMSEVVEEINEKHMAPWGEACALDGICSTPLSPFVEEELLQGKPVCVDGSKIEALGFEYQNPVVTKSLLHEILTEYMWMGLFPSSLLQPNDT